MAPPQQSRVLRCCSCRLFQAHQVKRSLQWTCKACGEKQSLLRTYGEGSGADCRRHVQKLNLLQGQASELSLRSPEDAEGPTGPGPTGGSSSLQGLHTSSPLHGVARPSESRWLKYLDKGPSAHSPEQPGPPCGQTLPSKRRRSTKQPPCSLHVQGLGNTRVTLESQDTPHRPYSTSKPAPLQGELPSVAPSSKGAQFLLSPRSRSQMGTEPLASLQKDSGQHGPSSPEEATSVSLSPLCRLGTPQRQPGPTGLSRCHASNCAASSPPGRTSMTPCEVQLLGRTPVEQQRPPHRAG
ncbi:MRN complex-interacting protein isoform X2 [Cavia porcellus]|uniref:MRN complex-interacting protein isoform X2 n=1 Tax=Cavia porcellus TaxID=10141 RepID=UPI002FE098C8